MTGKALLIDDEPHNLHNLQVLLKEYCPHVTVCGAASSAETATALLYVHKPDLVFLDIQMPGQNGFDFLRSLPVRNFEVIFVTAYDQYAIQAMRFAAIDYLLKPVAIADLKTAVDRALKQRRLQVQNQQIENLMQLLKAGYNKEDQRIALATAKETRLVKITEVVRCESFNNYTTFYLADGASLLVCKPIYAYEDLLKDHEFLRCHQSHLVNTRFVKSWLKESGDFLLLADGVQIPVSRGKKEEAKKALRL